VKKRLVLLGDRNLDYRTHRELDAALSLLPDAIRAEWVGTDTPNAGKTADADGLWVVPGSPYRNDAAVYAAITVARTSGQPFLGTCGGFQYTVIEFARNVAGLPEAGHAETAGDGQTLVVDRLGCSLLGEERLVTPVPGTRMHALCGGHSFTGFHWCSFGIASAYVETLQVHGLVVGAVADDAGVEAVELTDHPFFVATLFQPQVGCAAAGRLHPVIAAFIAALSQPAERGLVT
jgi:CTP synthase (UTP-ammonia lyase)